MMDVDPVSLDAQAEQSIALSGQVLLIGRASGIPDKQRAYDAPPQLGPFGPRDAAGSSIGQRPTPTARRPPTRGCKGGSPARNGIGGRRQAQIFAT